MSDCKRRRGSWLAGAVWAGLLAAAGVHAQGIPEADRTLIRTWLLTDCGLGESPKLEEQIRSRGAILEAPFLEALDKGPPPDEIAPVERLANERYQKRQQTMNDPNRKVEMSAADLEAWRKITRDDFVGAERSNFILRWRTQAIAGLALIGGDKSRKALRAIAQNRSSPLRDNAARALKALAGGPREQPRRK